MAHARSSSTIGVNRLRVGTVMMRSGCKTYKSFMVLVKTSSMVVEKHVTTVKLVFTVIITIGAFGQTLLQKLSLMTSTQVFGQILQTMPYFMTYNKARRIR